MRPVPQQVIQDVFVIASSILKCIRKNRKALKVAVIVDSLGKNKNGPGQPTRFGFPRLKWGRPEEITKEFSLSGSLCLG